MPNYSDSHQWPDSVIEWAATSLVDVNNPSAWIKDLVELMLEAGLPLTRVRILHQILHPQLAGISYCWTLGCSEIDITRAKQGLLEQDNYLASPFRLVCDGEVDEIRRSTVHPVDQLDFPVLKDLKAQGMTDYFALPLNFSDGRIGVISLATNQPNGFTKNEEIRLRQIVRAATRGVEILIQHETALSLICAYLGNEAGERVLSGAVQRGDGETINAVIWFSDLRKSTRLSEELLPDDYLALLNQYFDCLAGAVLDQGGEVLRFIGDAVLAIFPVGKQRYCGWSDACNRALKAAEEAELKITYLNEERSRENLPSISYGIGLHSGAVHYGNIGTAGRVEFTVVGKAANEAAKIESLCKKLQQPLLVSEAFTQYHQGPWQDLGKHQIPGIKTEINLFSPSF